MLKKWKLLSSDKVFSTKWLSIEKRSYKLPNGKVVDDYYHFKRPDYVLVIARNKSGKILLEKQFRRGIDDFIFDIPAGWIEPGETPLQAAVRELKEETGYKGSRNKAFQVIPQPGYSSQLAYVVFLEVDSELNKNIDFIDDENIESEFVSMEKIDEMIAKGQIKDMGALAALAIYDRIK